ncbi:MAG: DNA polymerase III subunit gamma/tau [Oscillospiraceae bacterium]|nr:DNA polymerase III subunit gamma/tau [Oscillospiraceae bacterium]
MDAIYQALYRKYRPRTLDEVCGQDHITETLKAQVASGRLSHAYLFIGTRGTGKTSCAKILAKAVNCEHPVNGNPCCQCAACRGIDDGTVMDVVEIDAASNNGVDNIRALRDEAVFSPASVKKRVYIVDEVHMLSIAAFNALLKILEEPPEHLMFILATTELRKVPATILSRCQRYSFRRLDAEVISKRLDYIAAQEGFNLTEGASKLLARLADGGMRDAISLLDQCSSAPVIDENAVLEATGLAGNRRVADLLSAISKNDAVAALDVFSSLWRDGKDPASLLSDLCALMRDVLLSELAPRGGVSLMSGAYDAKTISGFARVFTKEELLRNMQRAQDAIAALRDSPSPRTCVELCLVSLCDPALNSGIPELLARISRLEAGTPPPRAPAVEAAPEPEPISVPESEHTYEPAPEEEAPPTPEEPPAYDDGGYIRDEPEPTPEPVGVYYNPEPPMPDRPDNFPEPDPSPAPSGMPKWSEVTAELAKELKPALMRPLTDSGLLTAEFTENSLHLTFSNSFAERRLNTPETMALIRAAASKLAGRPLDIEVTLLGGGKQPTRSVEELRGNPFVKFV